MQKIKNCQVINNILWFFDNNYAKTGEKSCVKRIFLGD